MEFSGKILKGEIVPDEKQDLPEGARVRIVLLDEDSNASLGKRLLRLSGIIDGLPDDFAENHDHYIHGQPKEMTNFAEQHSLVRTVEQIQSEIEQLPVGERRRLIYKLIVGFDGPEEEEGVSKAWREEAERRYRELESGQQTAVPADDVFRGARARLA